MERAKLVLVITLAAVSIVAVSVWLWSQDWCGANAPLHIAIGNAMPVAGCK